MTTAASLPRLGDLLAVWGDATPSDESLARAWRRADETAFWFSRSAWALAALVRCRRQALNGRRPRLWLPDYFCNQSTEPTRAEGADVVFYPIGPELKPRWEECARLATETPPDLFVLVHFFGAAGPATAARDFCRGHDALLVEDAAHVLWPAPGIGEVGDAVFYSPHKLLAVPDGALLLIRQAGLAADIGNAARALGDARPASVPWLVRRLAQKMLPDALLRLRIASGGLAFDQDPPFTALPRTPGPSALGRRLLARELPRIDAIAAARGQRAEALGQDLVSTHDVRLFAPARAATVPYRLVLDCGDPANARRCYTDWRRRGLPVETWPDMAPEVLARPEFHADALRLRRTLLFVPIHQGPVHRRSSSSATG